MFAQLQRHRSSHEVPILCISFIEMISLGTYLIPPFIAFSFISVDSQNTIGNKCLGPVKCGENKFCVGFEGNKVYCYGLTSGCKWYTNDCTDDSDCFKYNTSSPKCSDWEGDCSSVSDWRADACKCLVSFAGYCEYGSGESNHLSGIRNISSVSKCQEECRISVGCVAFSYGESMDCDLYRGGPYTYGDGTDRITCYIMPIGKFT